MKDQEKKLHFEVDRANLYREEGYTDLKSATVKRLIPVKPDGSADDSRKILYYGQAELISPQGPIPIQAELAVNSLGEALDALPEAMEKAADDVRKEYNRMYQQQRQQEEASSKIIKSTDEL